MALKDKIWLKRENILYEEEERLAAFFGLHPIVIRALINRGISDSFAIMEFMNPYYAPLPQQFESAIETMESVIRNKGVIFIHGDYDVDGITSTAILYRTLTRLGIRPEYFIPHRVHDGYGLKETGVRMAHEKGANVLVTVDCGINSYDEIELAKSLGMKVIVLDHHQPGKVADTPYIVSGELLPESAYHHHLSGAGVTFMFCVQLARRFGVCIGEDILEQTIELAALGTLADVVPLLGINRWIVKTGVHKMKNNPSVPLQALLQVADMDKAKLSASNIPFALTPMINAAGRLTDTTIPVALLLSHTVEDAMVYAEKLAAYNIQRQRLQEEHLKAGIELAEKRETESVIIAGLFPHGVAGLIASKLVEAYGHPAIVFCVSEDGMDMTGSARSVAGINLHEILVECKDLLIKFGGHAMAAGMKLRVENFGAFVRLFEDVYQRKKSEVALIPPGTIYIDAELTHKDATFDLINEISLLEPFGSGNPKPVFLLRNAGIESAKQVGSGHLKCMVSSIDGRHLAGIGFGLYERYQDISAGTYDLVVTPEINVWNDNVTVQLSIKDIKMSKRGNAISENAFKASIQKDTALAGGEKHNGNNCESCSNYDVAAQREVLAPAQVSLF